jgi:hypothetical protein
MYGLDLDAEGNLLQVIRLSDNTKATQADEPKLGHPLRVPKSILFFKGDCWYSGGVWRCF